MVFNALNMNLRPVIVRYVFYVCQKHNLSEISKIEILFGFWSKFEYASNHVNLTDFDALIKNLSFVFGTDR